MTAPAEVRPVHCTSCAHVVGLLSAGALRPGSEARWKCRRCKAWVAITGQPA